MELTVTPGVFFAVQVRKPAKPGRFIVRLDSVDKLARLDYDLTTNTFSLHCAEKPCVCGFA